MTEALNIAKQILLAPASLDERGIEQLFQTMMSNPIDDADLYFQSCSSESWFLEDSEVKSGSFSLDRGVGIPVAQREAVKRPFIRLDAARSDVTGSGLGLAIVDRAARLHRGEFHLEERDGGGLVARLVLG